MKRSWFFRPSRCLGATILAAMLSSAVPSWVVAQSIVDRGAGHRIRPFVGVGSSGYNIGLEGEYALQSHLSLVGGLQGWVLPDDLICVPFGSACRVSDGWGMGAGLRVSAIPAIGPLSWWFFVQAEGGFYSFARGNTGPVATFGGRVGIVARLTSWLEAELGMKYQRIGQGQSSSVVYPAENWGGILLGFGLPID